MSTPPLRPDTHSKFGPYARHVVRTAGRSAPPALEAGERVGRPLRRRRKGLATLFLAALTGVGAWAAIANQAQMSAWGTGLLSAVASLLEVRPVPQKAATLPTPSEEPPPPALETRVTPPMTVVPASAVSPLPLPKAEESSGQPAAPAETLPPVVADPADPQQVRALAAGLHPGLSRALLGRLTAADYRNAETAIRRALAETPDGGTFVYPRKPAPGLAVFQVKFVRGATPDCRRYVVMVTKDGWLTTAMPMEKCGDHAKPARKGT